MFLFGKTQISIVNFVLLATLVIAGVSQAAEQVSAPPLSAVGVLGSDNVGPLSDVQAKLIATGQFSSVAVINTNSITPSLAALQAFDAVLIWSNANYADPVTLGNNLADYHDGGGGVVTATFEGYTGTPSLRLEGRWETDTYNVFVGGLVTSGPATLGTVHDAAHPVMAGVTSFDGGSTSFRPSSTGLTVGSILIAEWSDGMPLVAVKECFNGRPRVDLGFLPPSSDVDAAFWQSSTDGALLMANALSYVANPPDADGDGIPDCTDTPSVHNLTQFTDHFWIQAALDLADNGDVIAVDPGTYHEAIDFKGLAVTLRSTSGDPTDTIIDGTGYFHVVQCVTAEGPGTVLEGFTITGGNANGTVWDQNGGGMLNNNSSPTITNCRFISNAATWGGGMYNYSGSPTVTNCSFSSNSSSFRGGGMYNSASSPTLTNCLFTDNSAISVGGGIASNDSSSAVTHCRFTGNSADFGGGMYFETSNATVVNCSFSGNSANTGSGGGIRTNGANNPTVINCIFWGDLPNEINNTGGTPTFAFCDVEGGLPVGAIDGGGNISDDPLFVDADGLDNIFGTDDDNLRLQPGSPAIDAADSTLLMAENITTDLDGNLRFVNFVGKTDTGAGPVTFLGPITFLDMGPYETQFDCIIPGDINCDGIVNMLDLAIMGNNWLVSVPL